MSIFTNDSLFSYLLYDKSEIRHIFLSDLFFRLLKTPEIMLGLLFPISAEVVFSHWRPVCVYDCPKLMWPVAAKMTNRHLLSH